METLSLGEFEASLTPGLYALRQALRGLSDRKLARRVWGAHSRLAYHDRDAAFFENARDWIHRQRQEDRIRITAEIAVLEAEYKRRPAAARWPTGLP